MRARLYEVATGCSEVIYQWFQSLNVQQVPDYVNSKKTNNSVSVPASANGEHDRIETDKMDISDCEDVGLKNPQLKSLHLQRSLQNQFDACARTSASAEPRNKGSGMNLILDAQNKEFLGDSIKKFTKQLVDLTSGTDTALASALHCFGQYSGAAHTLGKKKRKSIVNMKTIGIQPTAASRRKMTGSGRNRVTAGAPTQEASSKSVQENVPFSSQVMPQRKAQHNLAECVNKNQSLGRARSAK